MIVLDDIALYLGIAGYVGIVLTTWSLILWAKKRVNINGKFIASQLKVYDARVNQIEKKIDAIEIPEMPESMPVTFPEGAFDSIVNRLEMSLKAKFGQDNIALSKAAKAVEQGMSNFEADDMFNDALEGDMNARQHIAYQAQLKKVAKSKIAENHPELAANLEAFSEFIPIVYQARKRASGVIVQGEAGGYNPGLR